MPQDTWITRFAARKRRQATALAAAGERDRAPLGRGIVTPRSAARARRPMTWLCDSAGALRPLGLLMAMLGVSLTQWGCSSEFWGGGAAGALGAGAAYEVSAKQQLNKLNRQLESGEITREEYDIRADQVKRGSIVQ